MPASRGQGAGEAWRLEQYRDARGREPVLDYLRGLNQTAGHDTVRRIIARLRLLHLHGLDLTREHIATMADTEPTVFELRASVGSNPYRVLFYQPEGRTLVLLHGFHKKQDAVPQSEIDLAVRRARDDRKRRQEAARREQR